MVRRISINTTLERLYMVRLWNVQLNFIRHLLPRLDPSFVPITVRVGGDPSRVCLCIGVVTKDGRGVRLDATVSFFGIQFSPP